MLVLLLLGFVSVSRGERDGVFRIGVSSSGFDEVNRNDAAAALKAWAATVGKEQNLDGLLDVILLTSSVKDLRADLEAKRLDGLSVSVAEYMDLNLQVQNVYIPITEQGAEVSYAVVVRNDSEMSNLENLAKARMVMGKSGRMNLALPWLRALLANGAGSREALLFKDPILEENPSKAILQVFFHQADAALVIREAFDLACELNPQLREKLEVLAESPAFVVSFFIFPPGKDGERGTEKLENAILDLHTTPGGRQVLTVFKSSRMEKFPVSILDNTIHFLKGNRLMVTDASISETKP